MKKPFKQAFEMRQKQVCYLIWSHLHTCSCVNFDLSVRGLERKWYDCQRTTHIWEDGKMTVSGIRGKCLMCKSRTRWFCVGCGFDMYRYTWPWKRINKVVCDLVIELTIKRKMKFDLILLNYFRYRSSILITLIDFEFWVFDPTLFYQVWTKRCRHPQSTNLIIKLVDLT